MGKSYLAATDMGKIRKMNSVAYGFLELKSTDYLHWTNLKQLSIVMDIGSCFNSVLEFLDVIRCVVHGRRKAYSVSKVLHGGIKESLL